VRIFIVDANAVMAEGFSSLQVDREHQCRNKLNQQIKVKSK
jgi:hypothetical protein